MYPLAEERRVSDASHVIGHFLCPIYKERRHIMSLITEASLREHFKKNPDVALEISEKDIITPSAKQYLREKGIELDTVKGKKNQAEEKVNKASEVKESPKKEVVENHYKPFETMEGSFKPKFVSNYDGGYYEVKPEYMTHLKGNRLVFKDDKRIVFRGKVDSLQSLILEIQWQLRETAYKGLIDDLGALLDVSRNLLRAEVLEEPYQISTLFGLDDAALRAHSHDPKTHYGVQHFLPSVDMGYEVILLNKLRTAIRELELVAMETFRQGATVVREDLVRVLNRLSSATYILMCRIRGNYYG